MAAALTIIDGSGVDREITELRIIDEDEVDREIVEIWVIDANGTDRLIYDPSGAASFTATAVPSHVGGLCIGTGTAATSVCTATPTGGTGPYTYAWAVVSYDNDIAPTAALPTNAATVFIQTNIGVGEEYVATFRCTVTDANLETTTCDVSCHWIDGS